MTALSSVISRGLLSARPSAATPGILYYATDTGLIYRDNGSTWDIFTTDINGLTADASPDGAADYVLSYDASASGLKKVLMDNLPGGGTTLGDHGARVYHDTTVSIANNTVTALALNSERWDTDAYHDTSTNNSRLTIPSGQDGKYIINGVVRWGSNTAGDRLLFIRLDGTTNLSYNLMRASNGVAGQETSTIYELAAGQYVELVAYQNSGGALDLVTAANYSPEFMLQRLA